MNWILEKLGEEIREIAGLKKNRKVPTYVEATELKQGHSLKRYEEKKTKLE